MQLTGYTLAELQGQTPRLLQGPDTDYDLLQTLKNQLQSNQPFSGETVNYRKNGTAFQMQWSIQPYPTGAEPQYYIAVQRDITALRELEQQRRQLQRLVDIQTRVGTAGLDLQSLREEVAQIGLVVTGADGAAVEEAVNEEMVYTAGAGTAQNSVGLRLPLAGSLSGACHASRQPIHCRDTHIEPRVARKAAEQVGFRSGLLVPLIYADQCFGVLKVYSGRVNAFSDSDMEVLSMASQVLASSSLMPSSSRASATNGAYW
ncbi:PAS domain S-box protein [Nitrincola sp. A-D6]|uniref:PAS domain S-box protein n=1 Tax=Nitrincola sp. A-D6 TaxID=1545442 RepID=UPI0006901ACF|nr:GAF domain-containing protein [Nitrincola sp. A-D6]